MVCSERVLQHCATVGNTTLPLLQSSCRPALSRLLAASVGAQRRQEQPGFLAALLDSLLADMQRLVDKASAAAQAVQASAGGSATGGSSAAAAAATEATSSLRQVLALAACVLPLLDAAAASKLPSSQRHLATFLAVLRHAVEAAAAAAPAAAAAGVAQGSSAVAPAALTVELSGHVARLAALAPAAASAAAAGSGTADSSSSSPAAQRPNDGEPAAAADEEAARGMQQLRIEEPAGTTASAEQPQPKPQQAGEPSGTPPAIPAATQQSHSLQQLFAGVADFAASAAGLTSVLAQPAAVLALLGTLRSWLQMLAAQPVPLGAAAELLLPSGGGWLLRLREYGSRELVLQLAQLLLLLLQHFPAAVEALLIDTQLQKARLEAAGTSGLGAAAAAAAAALRFDLQLLQAAVGQMPPATLHTLWQQLLPLVQPPSRLAAVPAGQPEQPPHRLWLVLLGLLQAAAQRLIGSRQHAAGSVQQEVLALLASLLSQQPSAPEPVLLHALQWLEQAAAWPLAAAESVQHSRYSSVGGAAAAALQAAVACCEAQQADVRLAAFTAVGAWARGEPGSCLLLHEPTVAAAVFQAALVHLSDLHPPAAAAAEQLLVAAAAPLALSSAVGAASSSPPNSAPAEAVAVALQRQQLGFRSAQLRQWMDHLEGSDGPAAVLTAAGKQEAPPLQQWLPRLLHSMRAVTPPGEEAPVPASLSW